MANLQITTLVQLGPGDKILLASTEDRLWAKLSSGDFVLTLSDLKEHKLTEVMPAEKEGFREIVSIPKNSTSQRILSFCDMAPDEVPGDIAADLVGNGAVWTVPLGEEDEDGGQLEAVLFYRFRSSESDRVRFLALIGFQEATCLKNNENIVAMLDILGFQEIAATSSLDDPPKQVPPSSTALAST